MNFFDSGIWETASYVVTVIGLPVAIGIYIADQQDHVVRRLAPKSVINEVFNLPGSGRPGQELREFSDPANRTIYRIYTVSGIRIRPGAKSPNDFGGFLAGDSGSSDGQRAPRSGSGCLGHRVTSGTG